jgi:hypothetical protein
MKAVVSLLIGLIVGAGAMIWFYTNGGEITVAGYEWGAPRPQQAPATLVNPSAPAKSLSPSSPPKARMVIRDVTDDKPSATSMPTPPNATSNVTPPSGGNVSPNSPGDSGGNSLIVIKWPRW